MRIGGIASGMDTEQMVKDLMKAERNRISRFLRQEHTSKWKQEAFNDVNRTMANFILNTRRDLGIKQVSINGTLRQNATSGMDWIKSATSSNEGVVTATARGDAMNGNHKVEVSQLAENASVTSKNLPLHLATQKFTVTGSLRVETDLGYDYIEIDPSMSIDEFISNINNAVVKAGANKDKNLGLRAAYDKDLGQLMINTRETGVDKFIKISDKIVPEENYNGANPVVTFAETIFSGQVIGPTGKKGKDAIISFNGGDLIQKSTNNFTVFGIELNLRAKLEPVEPVYINVDTNVDGIYNKIKSFVDSYNELLGTVNGKVNEKQYRSFQPLMKEEKDAMSEKEIEEWEKKAKSGLLSRDETLSKTLQSIRGDLYKEVDGISGSFQHLTSLGITTGNFRDGGKLVIEENKLRAAISNDPEGVMDLFFKAPTTAEPGEARTKESGLIQRIYDGLVTGMKENIRKSGTGEDAALFRNVQTNILIDFVTKQSAISVLDKDLSSLNSRIAREETILIQREDRYWRQFTAMEKAMSQMNQQSTWLMSQLGMGQ